MAIDDVRIRARQRLEELIGVDEAAYVLGERPSGGWDTLVTKEHLALELAVIREELGGLRSEVLGSLHQEIRAQTRWFSTLVLATFGVVVAMMAAIGAALRYA